MACPAYSESIINGLLNQWKQGREKRFRTRKENNWPISWESGKPGWVLPLKEFEEIKHRQEERELARIYKTGHVATHGISSEVHIKAKLMIQKFNMIFSDIDKIIGVHPGIGDYDDICKYIDDTIGEYIRLYNQELISNYKLIIYSLYSRFQLGIETSNFEKQIIGRIIDYVFKDEGQNDFKTYFISTLINDSATAYDTEISCSQGIIDRFLTVLLDDISFRETNINLFKNVYTMLGKNEDTIKLYRDYFNEWSTRTNTTSMNIGQKRESLHAYIITQLNGNPFNETIFIEQFGDEVLEYAGGKRKTRKHRNKKKRTRRLR